MAVYSLAESSFLLNHLFDSRILFLSEKITRKLSFYLAYGYLLADIPGKSIQRELSGSNRKWDNQKSELLSLTQPVHAPAPHQTGVSLPVTRVGGVVTLNAANPTPSPKQEKPSCAVLFYPLPYLNSPAI
ncbi:MAG: hypothetical protein JSR33_07640 [Proteobacteria bacterium]|nr:hypothetical protein [Pseudomonadota bacterium]